MNQRETEFVNDLKDLLERHGCELEAEDAYIGYAECGEDIQIEAYATADHDCPRRPGQPIMLTFGNSIDAESLKNLLDSDST